MAKQGNVDVGARGRRVLQSLVRSGLTSQRLSERVRIVLMSSEGWSNRDQADELNVDHQRVRRWRDRWVAASGELLGAEGADVEEKDFEARLIAVLGDNPRSGTPPTFSPEQMAGIIALACEPPADSGLPVSHWTPTEIAAEAMKRGIVEAISPRQVDRFLARRTFDRPGVSTG